MVITSTLLASTSPSCQPRRAEVLTKADFTASTQIRRLHFHAWFGLPAIPGALSSLILVSSKKSYFFKLFFFSLVTVRIYYFEPGIYPGLPFILCFYPLLSAVQHHAYATRQNMLLKFTSASAPVTMTSNTSLCHLVCYPTVCLHTAYR